MPYAYETERSALFTEEGQRKFLEVRDQVKQAAWKQQGLSASPQYT